LALGKAIISTSIGAEGIGAVDDKNVLIADATAEWLKAIDRVLNEEGLVERLGAAGVEHTRNFDNEAIIENLVRFYHKIKMK